MSSDFKHITVVTVTGLQSGAHYAMNALIQTCNALPGSQPLLICPELPDTAPKGMRHVPIKPFGYTEYAFFILYVLHHFINTEFALIVQNDGWLLSADNWRSEFLNYDYIGAPSTTARVIDNAGTTYQGGFTWTRLLGQENTKIEFVQNGGFSLRSKALLRAPSELGLPLVVPPVAGLSGPPYAMEWQLAGLPNEDVQFCLVMRARLEQAGRVFAPLEVSRVFSVEYACPELHGDFDYSELFGHHNKYCRLVSIAPPIVEYESLESITSFYKGAAMAELLQKQGYEVRYRTAQKAETKASAA